MKLGNVMGDYIILTIFIVAIIAAVFYIVRQKKKGIKCIGCLHGKKCNSCSCNLNIDSNKIN